MQVSRDGVHSDLNDICSRCAKNNDECVFKIALSNYFNGGNNLPLSLLLTDCPEYIRTENGHARISWYDFNEVVSESNSVTYNPNATVRFNTGGTF